MNLIDSALIYAAGAGSLYVIQHFWPKGRVHLPDAKKVEVTLSGFGAILTHGEQSILAYLENRMSAFDDQLAAFVTKAEAAIAAAGASAPPSQDALDAAKAEQEAADAAKVEAAAAGLPG